MSVLCLVAPCFLPERVRPWTEKARKKVQAFAVARSSFYLLLRRTGPSVVLGSFFGEEGLFCSLSPFVWHSNLCSSACVTLKRSDQLLPTSPRTALPKQRFPRQCIYVSWSFMALLSSMTLKYLSCYSFCSVLPLTF